MYYFIYCVNIFIRMEVKYYTIKKRAQFLRKFRKKFCESFKEISFNCELKLYNYSRKFSKTFSLL